jgi:ferric iron reductase protein FhuF
MFIALISFWTLADDALIGYPELFHEHLRLQVRAPFQRLLHRRGGVLKFIKKNHLDQMTKAHTTILQEILERLVWNNKGMVPVQAVSF